jgi:hypothetical protein
MEQLAYWACLLAQQREWILSCLRVSNFVFNDFFLIDRVDLVTPTHVIDVSTTQRAVPLL